MIIYPCPNWSLFLFVKRIHDHIITDGWWDFPSYTLGCCRQISNIRRNKSQNFFSCRLVLPLSQSIKAMRSVDNEDVVGAAPTGDAPTTSEWSAMLLPTEVRLILENWRYIPFTQVYRRITGFSSGHPELPLLTVRMLQFLRHTKLTGKRSKHDDVIKRKNILRYWPFVRGIHGSSSNSPHKGQWRGALMFTLVCAGTNGWINNRDAGDLRRNSAHYDVTVV